MIQHSLARIALLMLLASRVEAAPPVDGVPTLEVRMTAGCKYAHVVIIAQVVNLQAQPQARGEVQTGDLKIIELIKENASEIPNRITDLKHIPPVTDSLGVNLEDQMTYLMFLKAPVAPAWEGWIPRLRYDGRQGKMTDNEFRSAVLMAKSACGR